MRLVSNIVGDRLLDELQQQLSSGSSLDVASPAFSLFAFAELSDTLRRLNRCRLVLPETSNDTFGLLGGPADRSFRNRLGGRWLARECAAWLQSRVEVRGTAAPISQAVIVAGSDTGSSSHGWAGNCAWTTDGLGLAPMSRASLIQATGEPAEAVMLAGWFQQLWNTLPAASPLRDLLLSHLRQLAAQNAPAVIYHAILFQLFNDTDSGLDEESVVKSGTGIRQTVVWKKLFKFQRDGVVGAIDKLERFGGCIVADSVGLGKTFEALAIIKYYELRNDRVLVLCPKRLRDNWIIYKANDRRNILAADRFNYDVLNHTDLSRDRGMSGDINLAHINWGNYDLVVIDESHNFRNKIIHKGHESRYERLMHRIIKAGVKTRVLMLSATPVNNRLADLKNQIAFVTEGNDAAFAGHGIPSIETTIRQAQLQFNRWQSFEESLRTAPRLMEMLGFDYFKLLDMLTIARSRKHVERYYGTAETGVFPERLKPLNFKPDVDLSREFPAIRDINNEILRLNLAVYAPLRYVSPHRQAEYEQRYGTSIRGGSAFFRQVDREESLVHLLRVNVLKRMESAVPSFALTVHRQLADVAATLAKIDAHINAQPDSFEELDIADLDVDDPVFESLLAGRKVKVLLRDVDLIRWRQDLLEDRNRLATLYAAASSVNATRDAKLAELRSVIAEKRATPLNSGNRKVLVFTAFADTARYLYENLAPWAETELQMRSALVVGSGSNQTNLPGLHKDLSSILTAFSPRSKERPDDLVGEGEVDLLIATDCISEGQNLQDCDCVVNYDIHWNPVRIIQRFGRIDRIGSPNQRIQLVNFWPNLELEEYINLEQRVSGRMVLLDVSATGEENIIEPSPGNQMNDLEYRRRQLLRLQDAVIDLEDLSSGIAITDLTLTDLHIDLANFRRDHPNSVEELPMGSYAVTTAAGEHSLAPGVLFCLRAATQSAMQVADPGYPLAPHFLVHVGEDGSVLLPSTQTRQILDRLKQHCLGRDLPDIAAYARFDRETGAGRTMTRAQQALAAAVTSIIGKGEERAVASLFSPGGTHAMQGEFPGAHDFEVVAFLVVLPETSA